MESVGKGDELHRVMMMALVARSSLIHPETVEEEGWTGPAANSLVRLEPIEEHLKELALKQMTRFEGLVYWTDAQTL